jgi:hypothetical protein
MTDLNVKALKDEALLQIQKALSDASSSEEFLAYADAVVHQSRNLLELPFETSAPDALHLGEPGERGRDVANAPLVYEFLGAMDPANASDPRLWTYLSFVTYREYMEKRWSLNEESNWKGRAETRWTMPRVNRGKLVRHGIARLWWIASLTHDPTLRYPLSSDSEDPFAYTSAVLANEDRVNALFDREAGAIPAVIRCVLEHVDEDPQFQSDNYIRRLMKEITLTYGYRDLGALDEEILREVVKNAANFS